MGIISAESLLLYLLIISVFGRLDNGVYACKMQYLVIGKVIVQCVLQFAQVLLLFLFLPFLSLLEDAQQG